MATPFHGRGATIGLGVESSWGTAVSRTNWLQIVSFSGGRTKDLQPRNSLGRKGAASANRRLAPFIASDFSSGSFEWECTYDDSTVLLVGAAMGASSVTTAGSNPYTHDHVLKEALHVGLTLEQILGNGVAEVFEGVLIDRLTLSSTAGGIMRGRVDWIAETSGGHTAAGSPSYSAKGDPILYHQASNLTWDTLDADFISMELTINNNLTRLLRHGSDLTKKPVRSGFQEVTMRVVRDYDASLEHVDYLAQTQADATITFSGTGDNELEIVLHNAFARTNPIGGVSGPGPIEQTIELQGVGDGTDEGLELNFTNTNSAATAN